MRIMLLLCAVIFFPFTLFAAEQVESKQTQWDKYLSKYISKLMEHNTPSFYSEYETFDEDKKEHVSVGLLIEFGNTEGLVIERSKGITTNLATVYYSAETTSFILEETHGGEWSYARMQKLIDNFKNMKFMLLTPHEVEAKIKSNP